MNTSEFFTNLPVVPSYTTIASSVADAGPTTSPVPEKSEKSTYFSMLLSDIS